MFYSEYQAMLLRKKKALKIYVNNLFNVYIRKRNFQSK